MGNMRSLKKYKKNINANLNAAFVALSNQPTEKGSENLRKLLCNGFNLHINLLKMI